MIDLKRTLKIMFRRTKTRPVPTFLFVYVLEIGNSNIDKQKSNDADDGGELVGAVLPKDSNKDEHQRNGDYDT